MQSSLQEGVFDDNLGQIFLFLHETICCDPSSEPSRRDGSGEGNNICFIHNSPKLSVIITKYSLLSRAMIINIKTAS